MPGGDDTHDDNAEQTPKGTAVDGSDITEVPAGGEEAASKKKTSTAKLRKKKSDLGGSGGMDSSKKERPAPGKLRRKGTNTSHDDGGSSEGNTPKTLSSTKPLVRRKSTDHTGRTTTDPTITTRPENSSLSLLSKQAAAARRGSKSGAAAEEASAASDGGGSRHSGGSHTNNKKGLVKKSSRAKSPHRHSNRSPTTPHNVLPPAAGGSKKGVDPAAAAASSDSTGMWDVPSFGGSGNDSHAAPKDASAAFDGGGGFSDFSSNDAFTDNRSFFPSSTFGGPTTNTNNEASSQSKTTIPEHEAFSSDATSFFDNTPGGGFGQQQEDTDAPPVFGSRHRDSLDTSPLQDPPRRKIMAKLSLVKNTLFSQQFACPPVPNPLNGNLIFCTSRDGEMYIQEVDPQRGFVPVLSSPILTPELHKKVTTKYNRSAYGVDNVLKLCVGVHRSHGQPRLRVVAVVDLLVLDSKHILRAMAVWQWGYGGSTHPVSLQFLLSPPSGTDYAYNPESIVAADGIVFVAGASAKGPCIFMCKPSVRESWSANFLAPDGKITCMAVTATIDRQYPYMAVGMADGSLSVWTYAAALKQSASKKNEPFRRLLYPLCRLDALWVLNSLQATNFAEDKKQKADGKWAISHSIYLYSATQSFFSPLVSTHG